MLLKSFILSLLYLSEMFFSIFLIKQFMSLRFCIACLFFPAWSQMCCCCYCKYFFLLPPFDETLFLPLEEPLLGELLKFFLASIAFAVKTSLADLAFEAAKRFSQDLLSFCFAFQTPVVIDRAGLTPRPLEYELLSLKQFLICFNSLALSTPF